VYCQLMLSFVAVLNKQNSKKMEHKNFKFKTNINCGGCVASVKPYLDNVEGISTWEVDTNNKDKVLIVEAEGITEKKIIETVQKAGFKIERMA